MDKRGRGDAGTNDCHREKEPSHPAQRQKEDPQCNDGKDNPAPTVTRFHYCSWFPGPISKSPRLLGVIRSGEGPGLRPRPHWRVQVWEASHLESRR